MNETDYRRAMEHFTPAPGLRERTARAVEENRKPRPRLRPVRTALLAAALCAALVLTAGAAALAARQAHIQYLDREQFQKEYNEYLEKNGQSPDNYNNATYTGRDFTGRGEEWQESWWDGPDGLVEEVPGTAEDGWTAKRVFKSSASATSYGLRQGQQYLETRYKAGRASDYSGLFDRWDLSWLEERYTANPYGAFARTIIYKGDLRFIAVGGEYRGQDGAKFNISWSWSAAYVHEDQFRVAGNKQFAELYTTADGMEVDIEMDTSETGKSVFWVTLGSGHNSFSMFGTQMELEDIHDILDSLNLSNLLEYSPAK